MKTFKIQGLLNGEKYETTLQAYSIVEALKTLPITFIVESVEIIF